MASGVLSKLVQILTNLILHKTHFIFASSAS